MSRSLLPIIAALVVAALIGYTAYDAAARSARQGYSVRTQRRAVALLLVVSMSQLWLWNIRIPATPNPRDDLFILAVKQGVIFLSAMFGVKAIGSLIGARSRMGQTQETSDGSS